MIFIMKLSAREINGKEQVSMARYASIGVAVLSIILALFAQTLNVAFLVSLAFAVAASANLPVILFTIYWKRFNTTGAISGMIAGLVSAIVLVALSPNVWNPVAGKAIFVGEAIFPYTTPNYFDSAWISCSVFRNCFI